MSPSLSPCRAAASRCARPAQHDAQDTSEEGHEDSISSTDFMRDPGSFQGLAHTCPHGTAHSPSGCVHHPSRHRHDGVGAAMPLGVMGLGSAEHLWIKTAQMSPPSPRERTCCPEPLKAEPTSPMNVPTGAGSPAPLEASSSVPPAPPAPPPRGFAAFPALVCCLTLWQPAEHARWCSAAHKEFILGNPGFWHG